MNSQNNHYKSASLLIKDSNYKPSNLVLGGRYSSQTKTGIRVSTAHKAPPSNAKSISDNASEINPLDFAQRVLKKEECRLETGIPNSLDKPSSQTIKAIENLFREKLMKTEKVRLLRTIVNRQNKDKKERIMRYHLEDYDEILDFTPDDEETFDLGMLRFQGDGASASLKIKLKYGAEDTEETVEKEESKGDLGVIVKELSQLRNKLFTVNLALEKENQTLGKIEYKRSKYRIYSVDKRLIYKIITGNKPDPKSRVLNINNNKGKEVGSILITHNDPFLSKCEVKFPDNCDMKTRLLVISVLFAIMDRQKPYKEKPEGSANFLQGTVFGFLSCAPKT